jgi:hypothetical protein
LFGKNTYYTYPSPTAHAPKLVWHLPHNISAGLELDSYWILTGLKLPINIVKEADEKSSYYTLTKF